MKKLVFFLVLFGVFTFNVNAQKVDSKCTPKVPNNWTLVLDSHMGKEIDFSKINIKTTPLKEGTNLSETFKKQAEVGTSACCLDLLIDNTNLIPENFKKITVIFTGTVYKEDNKYIVYRTLYYNNDRKEWAVGKNYGDYILENTFELSLN